MNLKIKSILTIFVLFFLIFIFVGYLLSDDLYFNRLIRQENIKTPGEAFAFVQANTFRGDDPNNPFLNKPIAGITPRDLLNKIKFLSCDEGAILLATIVHELGYETRLVDLIGEDNISHHTILEVNQDGSWKTYDTLQNMQGVSYEESGHWFNVTRWEYRQYPKFYNYLVQNNFFLKKIVLHLRKIPG